MHQAGKFPNYVTARSSRLDAFCLALQLFCRWRPDLFSLFLLLPLSALPLSSFISNLFSSPTLNQPAAGTFLMELLVHHLLTNFVVTTQEPFN